MVSSLFHFSLPNRTIYVQLLFYVKYCYAVFLKAFVGPDKGLFFKQVNSFKLVRREYAWRAGCPLA